MRSISIAALALSSALLLASSSQATNYGNFGGSTVDFLNVRDQNALFGAPTVSVDSLDFSPNTFEAICPGPGCPPSPLQVDDTLTLSIDAHTGSFLDDILLTEAGDTVLSSFLNAFAATSVSATVFIDIFELNGIAVNNINGNAQMVARDQVGDYHVFGAQARCLNNVHAMLCSRALQYGDRVPHPTSVLEGRPGIQGNSARCARGAQIAAPSFTNSRVGSRASASAAPGGSANKGSPARMSPW